MVFSLLRGVERRTAQISRVALVPFVLCYVTFEVLVGIGVGLLSDEVNALPTPEQAAGAKVIDRIFIASGGSIVERVVGAVTRIVVGATGTAVVLAGAAPTTAAA